MNWYLEIELRHGITDWNDMKENFILTFSFEDGFQCIDDALQEIRVTFFQTPSEPMNCVQPDWNAQLQHTLECYNTIAEEGKEDPCNINILESKGKHEVA